MLEAIPHDIWVFVIVTNQYAGNFQDELGGFLTGENPSDRESVTDLCDYFKNAKNKPSLNSLVLLRDDGGYGRIGHMLNGNYPNTRGKYNSVGLFFDKRPSDTLVQWLIKRTSEFNTALKHLDFQFEPIKFLEFKVLYVQHVVKTVKRYNASGK